MGDEQRRALARLFAEDEGFKAAMLGATSVEEAVRIAGEHGIDAAADDIAPEQGTLSEAELEEVGGGSPNFTVTSYCLPTLLCTYPHC